MALAEPMVLHSLLLTHWLFSQGLRQIPRGEGSIPLYQNRSAAIRLLNQELNSIANVPRSTLEAMITTTVLLAGQEVRCP